jgi:hypothetical protein
MIDILERFLQQINLHRSPINRITYNVVSSTTAADYIRSMHGEDADCDSMLLISLCYGKQIAVTEARAKEDSASADGFAGSAFSDEVMLNDVEQLKHLLPYDLGLAEKDCAWHSPLLTFAQLKSLKNMRIRTKESEDKDVRNGCRKHKDISKNEKKGETVCRHCGLIHSGTLDRLDQDQSAGPGATDQKQIFQSHLLHLQEHPLLQQEVQLPLLNQFNIKQLRCLSNNHQDQNPHQVHDRLLRHHRFHRLDDHPVQHDSQALRQIRQVHLRLHRRGERDRSRPNRGTQPENDQSMCLSLLHLHPV